MLNNFVKYKKEIDILLTETKEEVIKNNLQEIYNYIENVLKIIETEPGENSEIYVIIKNFEEEVKNLLKIYELDQKDSIELSDINFSIKILLNFGQEIEKYYNNLCEFEIMNTNAEIKLLENILKEDGFFEESN